MFNHEAAKWVEEQIAKSDAPDLLAAIVVADVLHQDIERNQRAVGGLVTRISKKFIKALDRMGAPEEAYEVIHKAMSDWDLNNRGRRGEDGRFAAQGNWMGFKTDDPAMQTFLGSGRSQAFDLVNSLGGSANQQAAAASMDMNRNAFQQEWSRAARDPANSSSKTYGRIGAGSKLLGNIAVATGNKHLATAASVGQFAGSYGPEAEKMFGPAIRRAGMRYKGSEKKQIDPKLKAVHMARVSQGLDPVEAAHHTAVQYLQQRVPQDRLAELHRKSGRIAPSEGVVIAANGAILSQASGSADDHYLPFNLNGLARMKGGEYVRTRTHGGLTSEDINAALASGVKRATVVSNSGVFTVDFNAADLPATKRLGSEARKMTDIYEHTLDALKNANIDKDKLDSVTRGKLLQQAEQEMPSAVYGAKDMQARYQDLANEYKSSTKLMQFELDAVKAAADSAFPDSPEQSAAYMAELVEQAEAKKEAKVMRLDGDGYATALEALREQFPYFISDVKYTSKGETKGGYNQYATGQGKRVEAETQRKAINEEYSQEQGRAFSGAKDKGYVAPNYNRPEAVQSGFFDPRIAGEGIGDIPKDGSKANQKYGGVEEGKTGKTSAMFTDYQNWANNPIGRETQEGITRNDTLADDMLAAENKAIDAHNADVKSAEKKGEELKVAHDKLLADHEQVVATIPDLERQLKEARAVFEESQASAADAVDRHNDAENFAQALRNHRAANPGSVSAVEVKNAEKRAQALLAARTSAQKRESDDYDRHEKARAALRDANLKLEASSSKLDESANGLRDLSYSLEQPAAPEGTLEGNLMNFTRHDRGDRNARKQPEAPGKDEEGKQGDPFAEASPSASGPAAPTTSPSETAASTSSSSPATSGGTPPPEAPTASQVPPAPQAPARSVLPSVAPGTHAARVREDRARQQAGIDRAAILVDANPPLTRRDIQIAMNNYSRVQRHPFEAEGDIKALLQVPPEEFRDALETVLIDDGRSRSFAEALRTLGNYSAADRLERSLDDQSARGKFSTNGVMDRRLAIREAAPWATALKIDISKPEGVAEATKILTRLQRNTSLLDAVRDASPRTQDAAYGLSDPDGATKALLQDGPTQALRALASDASKPKTAPESPKATQPPTSGSEEVVPQRRSALDNPGRPVYTTKPNRGLPLQPDIEQLDDNTVAQIARQKDFKQEKLRDDEAKQILADFNASTIGQKEVKDELRTLYNYARMQQTKRELGIEAEPVSLNMVFTGSPGTGKTAAAKTLGKLWQSLGILESDHFERVSAPALKGNAVGKTEENVRAALERAQGGVLLIDEAHALDDEHYGKAGIQALLDTEEQRGKTMVILAGYPDQIDAMLGGTDKGLQSRFATRINFPDYSEDELGQIGDKIAERQGAYLSDRAKARLREEISVRNTGPQFGQARGVQNLIDSSVKNQANRVMASGMELDERTVRRITDADIPRSAQSAPKKVYRQKMNPERAANAKKYLEAKRSMPGATHDEIRLAAFGPPKQKSLSVDDFSEEQIQEAMENYYVGRGEDSYEDQYKLNRDFARYGGARKTLSQYASETNDPLVEDILGGVKKFDSPGSSWIAGADYDKANQRMTLRTKGGKSYDYEGVTPQQYRGFARSKSKGKYYAKKRSAWGEAAQPVEKSYLGPDLTGAPMYGTPNELRNRVDGYRRAHEQNFLPRSSQYVGLGRAAASPTATARDKSYYATNRAFRKPIDITTRDAMRGVQRPGALSAPTGVTATYDGKTRSIAPSRENIYERRLLDGVNAQRRVLGMPTASTESLSDKASDMARRLRKQPSGSIIRTDHPKLLNNASPLVAGTKKSPHVLVAAGRGFKLVPDTAQHEIFHGKGGLSGLGRPVSSLSIARAEAGAQLHAAKQPGASVASVFSRKRAHGAEYSGKALDEFVNVVRRARGEDTAAAVRGMVDAQKAAMQGSKVPARTFRALKRAMG